MNNSTSACRDSTAPEHRRTAEPSGSVQNGEEEPTKKRKREKYVGKACDPCKRRKIRCGGGIPCDPCIRRKKYCFIDSGDAAEHESNLLLAHGADPRSREEIQGLHQRLATLETHLTNLTRALLPTTPLEESNASNHVQSPYIGRSQNDTNGERSRSEPTASRSIPDPPGTSPKDYLSFASGKNLTTGRNLGETSVTHALQSVEDRLNELGMPVAERDSAPGTPPMTPLPCSLRESNYNSVFHQVQRALSDNGVIPDRVQWDSYFEIYLTEVHLLYPFSNEASISETYKRLWQLLDSSDIDASVPELDTDKVCQMLLVLALGRCTVSTRVHTSEGIHSSGWSLYCTAMGLQGSLLDTVNDDSRPLSSLHTLVLVVIYLLRLDATERAQKVLSLAVVHAQHLGLHLNKTHDDMSTFDSEMFKRVWWCMYVLDRRVALVLGRPFIIQDNNISVTLPRDADVPTPGSVLDFYHMETDAVGASPIHYLNVMVGYSRLVGKVWETLFGTESSTKPTPHVHEYLDSLALNWMESVPKFLLCDENDVHQPAIRSPSTLFKQRFLIRLRYLYISIMIKSPMRRGQSSSPPCGYSIESDSICLQRARAMIGMFAQCSAADAIYGFPFLPYLLEATITILSCLTRLPNLKSTYRDTAENAQRMLTQFCKKSWVSGKMARMIFKLGDIIPKIFATSRVHDYLPPQDNSLGMTESSRHDSAIHLQQEESLNQRSHIHLAPLPQQSSLIPSPILNNHSASSSNPAWRLDPSSPTPTHLPTHNSNHERHFSNDDTFTNSTFESSMMVDFPFETNFGSMASHAIAPTAGAGASLGVADRDDFSTPFLGTFDLEWLNELLPQESRLTSLG